MLHSFETAAMMRDLRCDIKPVAKCTLVALRLQGGGTIDEIASMLKRSTSTVYSSLEYLRSKGMVVRSEHLGRNGGKFFTYKVARP